MCATGVLVMNPDQLSVAGVISSDSTFETGTSSATASRLTRAKFFMRLGELPGTECSATIEPQPFRQDLPFVYKGLDDLWSVPKPNKSACLRIFVRQINQLPIGAIESALETLAIGAGLKSHVEPT
jgi:hypothetical protein